MAVSITHAKVSGKPAGSDPERIYGTHWDADHVVPVATDSEASAATSTAVLMTPAATLQTINANLPSSSVSAPGVVELATNAETVTGTDTARATTPANITAKMSAPGAIGNTTPSTGAFTTLAASGLISANGGQIAFPASQSASANANTLDDYEEGTFTPAISFATPGNLSVTYFNQTGRYTKIGRIIFGSFLLQTNSFTHTTASSYFLITGLPFTPGQAFVGAGGLIMTGYTKAGFHNLILETGNAATLFYVVAGGSGVSTTELVAGDIPSGGLVAIYSYFQYEA